MREYWLLFIVMEEISFTEVSIARLWPVVGAGLFDANARVAPLFTVEWSDCTLSTDVDPTTLVGGATAGFVSDAPLLGTTLGTYDAHQVCLVDAENHSYVILFT